MHKKANKYKKHNEKLRKKDIKISEDIKIFLKKKKNKRRKKGTKKISKFYLRRKGKNGQHY